MTLLSYFAFTSIIAMAFFLGFLLKDSNYSKSRTLSFVALSLSLILVLTSCEKENITTAQAPKANATKQNYDSSICTDWYNASDGSYITTTGDCSPIPGSMPPSPSFQGEVVGVPGGFGGNTNNVPFADPNAPAADLNYSGDAVEYPDTNNPPCPGNGPMVRMPSFIETSANHSGVHIQFGMTTSDNLSADQLVSAELVAALQAALTRANTPPRGPAGSKPFTPIFAVYVKATTNGSHAATSNHYRGLAVDISRINDEYVQDMPIETSGLVYRLQNSFIGRENFGPTMKTKLGQPYSVGGHSDHVHFSVNCN